MLPEALLALAAATASTGDVDRDCLFDREAMLALDERSFDQNPAGGWRELAARGCDAQAADLIRDWRETHRSSSPILFWHEGQNRAFVGDYAAAKVLFARSRRPAGTDGIGWNHYVDGSIAFLDGDLPKLRSARHALSMLPKPDHWDAMRGADGQLLHASWPVNLHVLDGFVRCWGDAYRDAYGCPLTPTESIP